MFSEFRVHLKVFPMIRAPCERREPVVSINIEYNSLTRQLRWQSQGVYALCEDAKIMSEKQKFEKY